MSQEALERARLALQLREAHEALERLSDERLRLARKNELLCEVMHELRASQPLSELAQRMIERALAFDGQPWSLTAGEEDDEPEGLEVASERDAESDP